MKKKFKIITLLFLLTIIGICATIKPIDENKNTKISTSKLKYQEAQTDNNLIIEQNILYAMDQLDDNMTDHEKSLILGAYTQEGSVYGSTIDAIEKQTYESVFLKHDSVCAGFNDAFRLLNNTAGLSCEMVTSNKGNHAWNMCNLDNEWTYFDATKGNSTKWYPMPYADLSFPLSFTSRSDIPSGTASMYNFTDARLKPNHFFNLANGDSFPIGTTDTSIETFASSRIYYDENYKYYIDSKYKDTWTSALYKENRKTKAKEKLADTIYLPKNPGLVKDNNKLYYIGTDGILYSMDINTKTKTKEVESKDGRIIGNVFIRDGYINYSLFDEAKRETEVIKLKNLDSWPVKKTYKFNDNTHNYALEYIEASKGISILRAVSLNGDTPSGTLTLPDTINNKKVIGIASEAFQESEFSGKLVLPKYLEYIGSRAFYWSKGFTESLELPTTLKAIRYEAFSYVPISGELVIPDSVTYIGYDAFGECSISSLKLGKGLKYISNSVFSWNRELDGVVQIPDGIEYIGGNAFRYCFKLKAIIIPESVKEIGKDLISKDEELEEIIIESKNLDYMGIGTTDATIYLHDGTKTSKLADSNNLEYQDLISKVTFKTKEITGNVGDIINLDYTITPKYYNNGEIKWESNNQTIATITNGQVKLLKEGDAVITATTKDGVKETCTIKVQDIKLELNYYEYQMDSLSDKLKLDATLTNGEKVTVTWESENSSIATVDKNGNVTPKDAGFVYITATYDSKKTSCLVFVNTSITLSDGRKGFLGDLNRDGKLNSEDSSIISDLYNNKNATKDDILLADLNRDGKINIYDSLIIIDAYINNYFHTGIYKSIEGVTLNTNNIDMEIGTSKTLIATITPIDTTDSMNLTWASSSPNVATITNGHLVAKASGTTTITVTTSNGKTAKCLVTVKLAPNLPFIKGDLNRNGVIEVVDAVEALKYYVELNKTTTDAIKIGDFNNNNKIDVSDAVEILKIYINK